MFEVRDDILFPPEIIDYGSTGGVTADMSGNYPLWINALDMQSGIASVEFSWSTGGSSWSAWDQAYLEDGLWCCSLPESWRSYGTDYTICFKTRVTDADSEWPDDGAVIISTNFIAGRVSSVPLGLAIASLLVVGIIAFEVWHIRRR